MRPALRFNFWLPSLIGLSILAVCCREKPPVNTQATKNSESPGIELIVLGTTQDAGSPQIGCEKACCRDLFNNPETERKIVSLGVSDNEHNKTYLFEATPDISSQLRALNEATGNTPGKMPDGVFLTHAHIGHYTGLMFFGKEASNTKKMPVYAMDRISGFLSNNGPWGQLVTNENISLFPLAANASIPLGPSLSVTPVEVPHRDEYSETVGYLIQGPDKRALFIPDIDKWERWEVDIANLLSEVDYAFLDATFYSGEEIDTRDISEIPHPFVIESMALFENLPPEEKQKVYFIHFNHTNPLLVPENTASKKVLAAGFHIASYKQRFEL
jgi:pyrroloquinoline quinone biosynthesis protein B